MFAIHRTAVLVDAGFFLPRYRRLYGEKSPEETARDLHRFATAHLYAPRRNADNTRAQRRSELYRIFVYDCPPLTKRVHNPVTGRAIDYSTSAQAVFRQAFHAELRRARKVALRLGYLDGNNAKWVLHPPVTKKLLRGEIQVDDLQEHDVFYDVRQKSVDMKIGLDIASLAFKRQVDQIVLISGDSDFVPAAKLARREGIDFVLDAMWSNIREDLHEHIDGLRSTCPKPRARGAARQADDGPAGEELEEQE